LEKGWGMRRGGCIGSEALERMYRVELVGQGSQQLRRKGRWIGGDGY